MLAAFVAWRGAASGDEVAACGALHTFGHGLRTYRYIDAGLHLTDLGRDLVARWQAEREADIEARATAAKDTYDGAVTDATDECDLRGWVAVVRAVDASGGGR